VSVCRAEFFVPLRFPVARVRRISFADCVAIMLLVCVAHDGVLSLPFSRQSLLLPHDLSEIVSIVLYVLVFFGLPTMLDLAHGRHVRPNQVMQITAPRRMFTFPHD
jgi:hypothetical protein